ncbi:hypothetical protein [Anaerosporomusa subterranea]|nr:hypothetical protein [Anaerosporomusa subterranea]
MMHRGDRVEQNYAATYKLGKTTVNVVAPPPMTEEQKEQVLCGWRRAFWAAWDSLSDEDKLALNAEAEVEEKSRAASKRGGGTERND